MDLAALVGSPVRDAAAVGGGCINDAYRVTLADGSVVFAKVCRPGAPTGMFAAEAAGLRWLADAGAPVPGVLAVAGDGLVLEWLAPSAPAPDHDATLGRALAALHRAGADHLGFPTDGFIGDLPQANGPLPSWSEFYAERRIRPLVRLLVDRGALAPADAAVLDRVCARLPELGGPPEPPARLHGDLWAGNVLVGPGGTAWLVDPAAYGGHREVDLAMMRLFGGFSERVFAAYAAAFPLADGWADRVGLWQVSPLLVHAVLFGGTYVAAALAAARRYA